MGTNEGIKIGKVRYSDDLSTVLSADMDIEVFELVRGVRCIGNCAFSGCRNLRVVRIPETVIRIEDYAFCDCTSIVELHLPYYMEHVSPLAFVNSDLSRPFLLHIPNVCIPRDAFRKYAYMTPQFVSWLDHDKYGVTLDELEEEDGFDYVLGFPILIDEHETYRMAIINDLDRGIAVSSDLEREVEITGSDERQIGEEMWALAFEDNGFLQTGEIVDAKDHPIIDNIDRTFSALLEYVVRSSYSFGWNNRPVDNLVYALSESLKWGAILPLIWDEPDDPEMYDDNLFIYCKAAYGDLVGHYENDCLRDVQRINEWNDHLRLDHKKILLSCLEKYNKRGYSISIPLFHDLFHACMKMMFHMGLSYGFKCREQGL